MNLTEADPECDLDYVPNQGVFGTIKVALSESLGFGDITAHWFSVSIRILKEHEMNDQLQSVEDLLTHRDPFLFLDELVSATEDVTIGKRYFRRTNCFFVDTSPIILWFLGFCSWRPWPNVVVRD